MNLTYDPNDTLHHIGEALGLLLVAIAEQHDHPMDLLDSVQHAATHASENPTLYAPATRHLVLTAAKALEGSIAFAQTQRSAPN